MTMRGYFVTPDMQWLPVATTHIAAVIDDPQAFGLDAARIAQSYARHGEAPPLEGKARAELLVAILEAAPWIRVREQRQGGWTVQLALHHADTWTRLQGVAQMAMAGSLPLMANGAYPTDPVTVLDACGNRVWSGSLQVLASPDSLPSLRSSP